MGHFRKIPYSWYAECPIIGIVGVSKSPYLCRRDFINLKFKENEDNESNANARVLLLLYDGDDNERKCIYNNR